MGKWTIFAQLDGENRKKMNIKKRVIQAFSVEKKIEQTRRPVRMFLKMAQNSLVEIVTVLFERVQPFSLFNCSSSSSFIFFLQAPKPFFTINFVYLLILKVHRISKGQVCILGEVCANGRKILKLGNDNNRVALCYRNRNEKYPSLSIRHYALL